MWYNICQQICHPPSLQSQENHFHVFSRNKPNLCLPCWDYGVIAPSALINERGSHVRWHYFPFSFFWRGRGDPSGGHFQGHYFPFLSHYILNWWIPLLLFPFLFPYQTSFFLFEIFLEIFFPHRTLFFLRSLNPHTIANLSPGTEKPGYKTLSSQNIYLWMHTVDENEWWTYNVTYFDPYNISNCPLTIWCWQLVKWDMV